VNTVDVGILLMGVSATCWLLMYAGNRAGLQQWLDEPEETKEERWKRARAGGYPIPALEETVVPLLIGLLGGILGAYLAWDRWGALAAIGTLIVGGAALWLAVQIYTVWMVFRRDAVLRWHEEQGRPYPPNRWPLG
jgi:hypothetical protein